FTLHVFDKVARTVEDETRARKIVFTVKAPQRPSGDRRICPRTPASSVLERREMAKFQPRFQECRSYLLSHLPQHPRSQGIAAVVTFSVGAERCLMREQCPGDTSVLVGQCDRGDLETAARLHYCSPASCRPFRCFDRSGGSGL